MHQYVTAETLTAHNFLRDSQGVSIPVRYDWNTARSRSSRLNIYFNSSKVRLEQMAIDFYHVCSSFQFQYGKIGTERGNCRCLRSRYFNSSEVRLELEPPVRQSLAL